MKKHKSTTKYLRQFDRTKANKAKAWKLHLKQNPQDVIARKNIERLTGKSS